MKKFLILMLAGAIAASLLTACKDEAPKPATAPQGMPAASMPAGHPTAVKDINGTVLETMDSAGYTYVHVDTGKSKVWAAGPQTEVKVGETVALAPGQEMHNFHANSLNRTFDMILFVPAILVGGESVTPGPMGGMPSMPGMPGMNGMNGMGMPGGHPEMGGAQPVEIDFADLVPVDGGQTVGQIYAQKDALAGQEIQVRGKVVRFSPQIMGKNWIHLQDGTDNQGKGDITVTTNSTAQVGDTILVSGILQTNQEIAHGQVYEVIVQDAQVVVE
ncbi:hypothetical protein SAMN05660860_00232 [Geoalkalibacter ferrihydriticus]|uniref:DNA-binding protein n=1 Tax=Geoalkalibacter ferrihydriticus TaxID=392333 RepID=A0A1G9ITW5_9BACT|nr:hypothetical protein [Geoalkalibacter ferrihydriticus]SDL28373.1 hypothetical protein SAMN05660860_00232 [Geoalkalibacter ferrihydriticus]